jgi:hypothetical protein
MKTITLSKAFSLLKEKAYAITLGNGILIRHALADLTGEDENLFMYLSWGEDGDAYEFKFCEGDNRTVTVAGSSMLLYDTDAEEDADVTQITLLEKIQLEDYLCRGEGKSIKMSDEYKKWLTEDEIKPGQVWSSCDGAGIKVTIVDCKNDIVKYSWIEKGKTKEHEKSVFNFQVRYYLE